MTQLAYRLRQPFPLSIQFSRSFPTILGFGTYVVLFLFLFTPFGIEENATLQIQLIMFGYGIVVMLVMGLNFYCLPVFFPSIFSEEQWSLGRELSWLAWNTITCCVGVGIYGVASAIPECETTFLERFGEGLLLTSLPLSIYLLWSYNGMIGKKLATMRMQNPQTVTLQEEPIASKSISLSSESESEHLSLPLNALRFVESRDNYCLIVWWDGKKLRKQLLRSSLKRLVDQIKHPEVRRCHRSYLVNLSQVEDIRGNSRGYRLYLHNCSEEVPVSRENGRAIKEVLKSEVAA
ncbi:MAG: LytR/AlgR family response regulator transcription factor [Calditrichia bacterium]